MSDRTDDPFEVLDIEPVFELDVPALRRRVKRSVAAAHPDRIPDPLEREAAVRRTARMNEALRELEDDERRANHLLRRLGGPGASDDRSLPPEFLMEILEVREDMEQALASGDPAERERVASWAAEERARLRGEVGALFPRLAAGEDLGGAIRLQLNVWRYIERMIEQLNPEGLDPFAGPGDG